MSRRYEVRADIDELAVVEFRYPPGAPGPDRHVHRRHSDGFYVLEGELTIELADTTTRAGPGFFAAAPPGLVHTVRNEGSELARFLNVHAPGMGFPAYLEGAPFDQFEPPADGGRPVSDAMETDGNFSLSESTLEPGSRVPVAQSQSAAFYIVLEGTLSVRHGDELSEPGVGGHVLVPPGVEHALSNPAAAPVRFLSLMAPAGSSPV